MNIATLGTPLRRSDFYPNAVTVRIETVKAREFNQLMQESANELRFIQVMRRHARRIGALLTRKTA